MNRRRVFDRGALFVIAAASIACTTGEGEGWVKSDQLFVEDCWSGPFDLDPTFFAANPHREESMLIRVQRGDDLEEVSDGLIVLVSDLDYVKGQLGRPLTVGLPPGVSPPGIPIKLDPDPARVSLTLYLHDTCHVQNGSLFSIGGKITFDSIFSGSLDESEAEDRLTEATFEAAFADPRKAEPDGTWEEGKVSTVTGMFRFFFQRGQPAQPFP
jgi:hypothetical protein